MEAVMDVHGVWEAIEPQAGVAVDEKKNKTARAFIIQSISEDILLQVAKKKMAKEVWEAIKLRYLGADRVQKARLHTLKSDFEALRMKDGDTIDEFAGKLSVFRRGYYAFEEAIGRLKAYEDRLKLCGGNTSNEGSLLLSKTEGQTSQKNSNGTNTNGGRVRGSSYNQRGGRYGSRGRGNERGRGGKTLSRDHGNYKAKDKKYIKCFNCNEYGHYASECKASKDKRDESNLTQSQEEESALLLSICGEAETVVLLNEEKVFPKEIQDPSNNVWYLENGASNHMMGNKMMFAELNANVKGEVKFGDNSKVQIAGRGTC
ncbi:uncharacterized protein [Rutidosis leptorrhynchoides]|uniref:uncharacterized protein n=1 Tax=Rutidosis leptorrhynchoides TaxID=125765 RepID=UPI003A9A10B3